MIDSKFFKGASSARVLDSFVLCLRTVSSVFWAWSHACTSWLGENRMKR